MLFLKKYKKFDKFLTDFIENNLEINYIFRRKFGKYVTNKVYSVLHFMWKNIFENSL